MPGGAFDVSWDGRLVFDSEGIFVCDLPDLQEFFFARLIDGVQTMHHVVLREDGTWSDPRPLLLFPGGARAVADDMSVSPDGERLYFLGQHPHPGDPEGQSTDIWVSRRVDGGWSTAEVVPAPVSTLASEVYPVVVADGSLYLISNRPDELSPTHHLYRAQRRADGSFDEPVKVGPPINSDEGIASMRGSSSSSDAETATRMW